MDIQALIVDDEEQCVRMLQEGIDWKALGVSAAHGALSAEEARGILKDTRISLILCDIEMPGESGLEFIQWVREDAGLNGANVECIILTCYPDYEFMRKAMQMGCSDYLIKPIDDAELDGVLKKAIDKIRKNEADLQAEEEVISDIEKEDIIDSKVIPYIKAHYTEPLTVTDIAGYAALNPQYLMRLFKRKTGASILDYVTVCRMERARELLKKTQWTNEIISEKVGYASANYFIKQFKKQFGVTPREYRKKSLSGR